MLNDAECAAGFQHARKFLEDGFCDAVADPSVRVPERQQQVDRIGHAERGRSGRRKRNDGNLVVNFRAGGKLLQQLVLQAVAIGRLIRHVDVVAGHDELTVVPDDRR